MLNLLVLMQPGYLHKLLPDSAPDHPETLDQVLDGKFLTISAEHRY